MAIGVGSALLASGIASGVGSILSSGLQIGSQAWSQSFNRKEAEKTREFNSREASLSRNFSASESALNRQFQAEQAELNRQWQTDMSNSAYQRSILDMQKAGLNPNLVSGGAMQAVSGSSSVPQGSQASSAYGSSPNAFSNPVHFNNMFSGIANALNAYATIQNQKFVDGIFDSLKNYKKYNNNISMEKL